MAFVPNFLDYTLSPYTGLTRDSWMQAGKYLLSGIFDHLENMDAPVIAQRTETEVTYPHLKAPKEQQEREWKAEIFEGLTRSFFIASVVIHNEPEVTIGGIRLRDYYKKHILRVVTEGDPVYVGSYDGMQTMCEDNNPFRTFQQTVETCALVIGLWACESEIWNTYTKAEQDRIADFLGDWARNSTVPQNWRMFNMLDMAFLHMHGYPIDERIMLEHAQAILNYTVGDGWYRDGQSFDYYSCWAFNFYGPLWCLWYGYDYAPEMAAKFEQYSNELMKTYPDFFDRDGWTNMWGRSCIYRNAATSPFDGNLFLRKSTVDPGRARRIASGSLLQFMTRDDFLAGGVPSLGFYGQFTPLVQGYSCAESPFWLGKAFLCLHMPADHPFWTAVENGGDWDKMRQNDVKETVLDGPALAFTNHAASGETILRNAKVMKRADDRHGMWNYAKLSYNTKFPWEAAVRDNIEAQQYVIENEEEGVIRGNATYWCGQKNGVLYRRQFFNYRIEEETHWIEAANLADFPVPYGIVRADKLRLTRRPAVVRLGSYGFPDNKFDEAEGKNGTDGEGITGTSVICRYLRESGKVEDTILGPREILMLEDIPKVCGTSAPGNAPGTDAQKHAAQAQTDLHAEAAEERDPIVAAAIVLKGKDHMGADRQMAMTVYRGWESLELIHSTGTNPDSEHSIVICASMQYRHHYDAAEPHVLISQVITKETADDFTDADLFPLTDVQYSDPYASGAFGAVRLTLRDGSVRTIDSDGIEGNMSM